MHPIDPARKADQLNERSSMRDEIAARRVPTTVQIVIWIIAFGLTIDAAVAVFRLLRAIDVLDGTAAPIPGRPEDGALLLTVAAFMIVLIALEVFVLVKLRGGRNWARIVITVLEVLSVLSFFVDVTAVGVLGSLASLLIILLLWTKSSNAHFLSLPRT